MGTFLFWGSQDLLDKALDSSAERPDWLNQISDQATAKEMTETSAKPCLLFLTETVLKQHSAFINQLKADHPKLDIVYINETENTQTKIEWLKNVQVINHLLPIHSSITKSLFKRVLQEDWRQVFLQSPEKIFAPENIDELHTMKLNHVDQCQQAFTGVRDFLEKQACFTGFAEMMVTAASELLTNAFYNGPKASDGSAVTSDRKVKFLLPANQEIQFSYGKTEGYFWMSVSDCFGTLDRATLIKALNRAATEKTARTDTAGGAGLGLIMLFEWASEIGFKLSTGVSTTVACRFKISKRQKEFDSEPSVFHVFTS